jgi:hypothetical protein
MFEFECMSSKCFVFLICPDYGSTTIITELVVVITQQIVGGVERAIQKNLLESLFVVFVYIASVVHLKHTSSL